MTRTRALLSLSFSSFLHSVSSRIFSLLLLLSPPLFAVVLFILYLPSFLFLSFLRLFLILNRERERGGRVKRTRFLFFSFVRSQFCIFLASKVEEKKSVVTKNNWFVVFFILLVWSEFIF